MIFPDEATWRRWGIAEESHRFFVLRWDELFGENTFDTWQVRTCNVPSILNEILETVRVGQTHAPYLVNLEYLLDEATMLASRDFVVSKDFPFVRQSLSSLASQYQNLKGQKNPDWDGFRSCVNVIAGNLRDYRKMVIIRLRSLMGSPPSRYKNDLYDLTMCLAIDLAASGYSTPFLRSGIEILQDSAQADFGSRLERFLAQYDGSERGYECRFLVALPDPKTFPTSEISGVTISRPAPLGGLGPEERAFYGQDTGALIAAVRVTALDSITARDSASEKLGKFFSLSRLYHISKVACLRKPTSLVIPEGQQGRRVEPDISRLGYLRDSRNAAEKLTDLAVLLSQLHQEDVESLTSSLQYHDLALAATTDNIRLVNLWIALECLVRRGHTSIIDAICTVVPQGMATGYLYRAVKALAIDLHAIWRKRTPNPLALLLHQPYGPTPHELLDVLLEPNDGPRMDALQTLVSPNPLLIYRISRLRDHMLRGPKDLGDALTAHKRNVEWQLRRIYRSRNHVMHRGTSPVGTRHLIQHLHGYVVITLHNTVHDLQLHPRWSIADTFEHRRLIYEHLLDRLGNYEGSALSVRALLNPSLALRQQRTPLAWVSAQGPAGVPSQAGAGGATQARADDTAHAGADGTAT